jgi:glycosyltransferase involved in cell wall biosynthesis
VTVIENGIDPAEFDAGLPAEHPRPYVLGVGRLTEQKGFDLLIDAFAAAAVPLDLILAGSGPDLPALRARAEGCGLTERVHFLGHVDREVVLRLLRGATVVAMPSRFEGHPLICLEAMQAGAPLVASNLPGLPPALRDGETGVLIPPGDVGALASALRSLAGDSDRARRLGRAAAAAARSFMDWRQVTDRVLGEYDRVAR